MHWIIGDIKRVKEKLPDNVRLDVAVPILPPARAVHTVTYLVDTDDALDRISRGIAVLRWAIAHRVKNMRVNDKDLAEFLKGFTADVQVHYDARVVPCTFSLENGAMPEWWPGPNYIR